MNQPTPPFDPPDFDPSRRFGGLARLYGAAGAARIGAAHVAVVGIGGVGSWAAEALARSGAGRISLIDLDNVAESNVNRQIHALSHTIGQPKVQAMQARVAQINPACQVHAIEEFAEPGNWPGLLPAPVDGLVDACDQMAAKTALAAWALHTRTRFVTVGAAGGKRLGHAVEVADLADVTHDPLLAKLRYTLRRQHGAPRDKRMGVAAVFSREPVHMPELCGAGSTDSSLNCHGYGSSVAVTATFGLCAAGWLLDALSKN